MPDIWTFNRPKVKTALTKQGATCEVPPRVIKDREEEWTCHIDLDPPENGIIGYDLYIHDANQFYISEQAISLFILIFAAGFLVGFLWRPRFKSR
jgi:hypothetical protein